MVSLGFDAKNAVIFQMISDLDEDGNKQIDFEEWIHLMTYKVSSSATRAALRKIFALYDDEKTEHISIKNLRRVAMDLGIEISEE
jgi:centrin-3